MGGPAVLSLMSRGGSTSSSSRDSGTTSGSSTSSRDSGSSGSSSKSSPPPPGPRHLSPSLSRPRCRPRPLLVVAVGDNETTMRVTAKELLLDKTKKENKEEGEEEEEEEEEEENEDDSTLHGSSNGNGSNYGNNGNGNGSINSSGNGNVEIVHVRSYAECAGVLAAHRGGIRLDALTSRVSHIPITRLQ